MISKRHPMFDHVSDDYTITDALVDAILEDAEKLPPDSERVARIKKLFDAKITARDDSAPDQIIVGSTEALAMAHKAGIDVDYMPVDDAVAIADFFVCSDKSYYPDDLTDTCARCERAIVHRPDAPTALQKICLFCFAEIQKAQRR